MDRMLNCTLVAWSLHELQFIDHLFLIDFMYSFYLMKT